MGKANQLCCHWCNKLYYATRSDSKWCSEKCRREARYEDSKFDISIIPKSNIPGLTYNRIIKRWELRLLRPQKYVGTFLTIKEALEFRDQNNLRQQST